MPRALIALALLPLVAAAAFASSATGGGPLKTAVVEPWDFANLSPAQENLVLERIHGSGATLMRTTLSWYAIAPKDPPPDFDPENPSDPAYDWERADAKIEAALAHGLEPYLAVNDAPVWARTGQKGAGAPPNPSDFGKFMRAAAERYSGQYQGLPRIRYWQVWIEPNVNKFFKPQYANGKPVSPAKYAALVNAAAVAVHGVHADNKVIAGGLSPFTVTFGETNTIGPMKFMREMLCMTTKNRPRPSCSRRVHFDIWSHHPFTTGGPYHHARRADDVSLGDLPEMKALLVASYKAHHALSSTMPGFWVTEFSWDTNPPDPLAVPIKLQSRWTAEAMYVMWKVGITLVTWLDLRDNPYPSQPTQSGLYWRGATLAQDKPKPTLTAFRFPFVAYRQKHGILVWGRTPWGKPGRVAIYQNSVGRWKQIAALPTNGYGIFSRRITGAKSGYLRAQLVTGGKATGPRSLAFSLKRPADRLIRPFG
ncbi:MAG TPA: hypothetical protein VF895_00170 [Gaiellaceae bacterium]